MAKGKNKEPNQQNVNTGTKRTENSEHQGKNAKNRKEN